MKNSRGFTLIELMIGIAIIGVLVAVAYPSYTNSLLKGSRANAKSLLLDVAQKQQQYLLDNRAYFDDADVATVVGALPKEFNDFYTLDVTPDNTATPFTFTARATPKAGTRQAKDGWLQIDQAGTKTSEKPDKW